MNASDHLTTSQISRFAAKALSVDESHAVGGASAQVYRLIWKSRWRG